MTNSSVVHREGKLFLDDPNAEAGYDRFERYRQSKLANLLFALELDRRPRADGAQTASVACHPGLATTSLGCDAAPWLRWMMPVAQPLRVAICGNTISPPIFDSVQMLGKEETLRRIDTALAKFATAT